MLARETLLCGDWHAFDMCQRYPRELAECLCTFVWPLSSVDEVQRFLQVTACMVLVCCECSGMVRDLEWTVRERVALSVDLQTARVPGTHAALDVQVVAPLIWWVRVYGFFPCTHQARGTKPMLPHKLRDGRTFWGMLMFNCKFLGKRRQNHKFHN